MVQSQHVAERTVVWQVKSVEEALHKKLEYKDQAMYIAGGTYLQLQREKGIPFPPNLISLALLPELQGISLEEEAESPFLQVGAQTSLNTCLRDPLIISMFPLLVQAIKQVAAPAVRNRGTIGGNLSFGSGDLVPLLLAYDASVSVLDDTGQKNIPLHEYINQPSENSLIIHVLLPLASVNAGEEETFSFYKKIGRREAFTTSQLSVAGRFQLSKDAKIIKALLTVGSSEEYPRHLETIENWLQGAVLTEETAAGIHEVVMKSYQPGTDAFSSAKYRKRILANILTAEVMRAQENASYYKE
ncbi:FAD binding domain-containing protein [Salsuginibacillus kocurii]|uniref:FAD binding domain-containing protein n=1 Tax=Salsuginibacillus kocurii TaxID=427078 RepID=UPI00037E30C2|nr:FAD binding domain-containing protein [Salsuginibacillus kocurii]